MIDGGVAFYVVRQPGRLVDKGRFRCWVQRQKRLDKGSEIPVMDVVSLMIGKELMPKGNEMLGKLVGRLVGHSRCRNVRARLERERAEKTGNPVSD